MAIRGDINEFLAAQSKGDHAGSDAALSTYRDPAAFARLMVGRGVASRLAGSAADSAGYGGPAADPLQPALYRDAFCRAFLASLHHSALCMIGRNSALAQAYRDAYMIADADAVAEYRAAQDQEDAAKSQAAALVAGALAGGAPVDNTAPAPGEPAPGANTPFPFAAGFLGEQDADQIEVDRAWDAEIARREIA